MQRSTLAKLLITAAVAIGGVGFLVKSSFSSAEHYMMVDELYKTELKDWAGATGKLEDAKTVKIHGYVEDGTDRKGRIGDHQYVAFGLGKNTKRIQVFFMGPAPDTFKPGSEVVAIGKLVPTASLVEDAKALGFDLDMSLPYVLKTDNMMAKCPSKYDGAQVNRNAPLFK